MISKVISNMTIVTIMTVIRMMRMIAMMMNENGMAFMTVLIFSCIILDKENRYQDMGYFEYNTLSILERQS